MKLNNTLGYQISILNKHIFQLQVLSFEEAFDENTYEEGSPENYIIANTITVDIDNKTVSMEKNSSELERWLEDIDEMPCVNEGGEAGAIKLLRTIIPLPCLPESWVAFMRIVQTKGYPAKLKEEEEALLEVLAASEVKMIRRPRLFPPGLTCEISAVCVSDLTEDMVLAVRLLDNHSKSYLMGDTDEKITFSCLIFNERGWYEYGIINYQAILEDRVNTRILHSVNQYLRRYPYSDISHYIKGGGQKLLRFLVNQYLDYRAELFGKQELCGFADLDLVHEELCQPYGTNAVSITGLSKRVIRSMNKSAGILIKYQTQIKEMWRYQPAIFEEELSEAGAYLLKDYIEDKEECVVTEASKLLKTIRYLNRYVVTVCDYNLYKDYIYMMQELWGENQDYDRFPKDVDSAHEEVLFKLDAVTEWENHKCEMNMILSMPEYGGLDSIFLKPFLPEQDSSSLWEKYRVIIPNGVEELMREGEQLCNCVASYVRRIKECKTRILFLREICNMDQPLCTIEVDNNNRIVQCKGFANGRADREIQRYMVLYAKQAGLDIRDCYDIDEDLKKGVSERKTELHKYTQEVRRMEGEILISKFLKYTLIGARDTKELHAATKEAAHRLKMTEEGERALIRMIFGNAIDIELDHELYLPQHQLQYVYQFGSAAPTDGKLLVSRVSGAGGSVEFLIAASEENMREGKKVLEDFYGTGGTVEYTDCWMPVSEESSIGL